MALRIEKAFGPDMDHLLRMQLAYDVAKTRRQPYGEGALIATKTDTTILETALLGLEAERRKIESAIERIQQQLGLRRVEFHKRQAEARKPKARLKRKPARARKAALVTNPAKARAAKAAKNAESNDGLIRIGNTKAAFGVSTLPLAAEGDIGQEVPCYLRICLHS